MISNINKNKAITELYLKNMKLKEKLKIYKEAIKTIDVLLYGCGKPLNDNVLQFNNDQLKYLMKIGEEIKYLR